MLRRVPRRKLREFLLDYKWRRLVLLVVIPHLPLAVGRGDDCRSSECAAGNRHNPSVRAAGEYAYSQHTAGEARTQSACTTYPMGKEFESASFMFLDCFLPSLPSSLSFPTQVGATRAAITRAVSYTHLTLPTTPYV